MMTRQWWNDTDAHIKQLLKLFGNAATMIEEPKVKKDMAEQAESLQAELDRRERARAIPAIPFGTKVEVIELLPSVSVCATPPVGMTGTSMGERFPGATEVRFPREALYPRQDDDDEDDDRDEFVGLFMPNYSIRAI